MSASNGCTTTPSTPSTATLTVETPAKTASETKAPETSADHSTDASPSPPRKAQKTCGVCHKEPGKYKCPRCPLSYCSVACNKLHKQNHPPSQPPPPAQLAGTKRPRPEATASSDPYRVVFDHRADLLRLYAKYPNLEADLARILRATEPPPAEQQPLPPPPAVPGERRPRPRGHQKGAWTTAEGLRRGMAELRRARVDPGEDGDAVREVCELIRFLLAGGGGGEGRDGAGGLAMEVVKREVVDEERGVIRGLIRMEGGEEGEDE